MRWRTGIAAVFPGSWEAAAWLLPGPENDRLSLAPHRARRRRPPRLVGGRRRCRASPRASHDALTRRPSPGAAASLTEPPPRLQSRRLAYGAAASLTEPPPRLQSRRLAYGAAASLTGHAVTSTITASR